MAKKYKIVIADEDKAHDAFIREFKHYPHIQRELRRGRDVWLRRGRDGSVTAEGHQAGTPRDADVAQVYPAGRRAAGTQVSEVPSLDCPNIICACGAVTNNADPGDPCGTCEATTTERRPNCRHCGDPAHADACQAAGHCPDCGVKHGVAPDAIVAGNGYELVEVEA